MWTGTRTFTGVTASVVVAAMFCALALAQDENPARKYRSARQLSEAVVTLETEVAALRQRLDALEIVVSRASAASPTPAAGSTPAVGSAPPASTTRGTRSRPLIRGPLEIAWTPVNDFASRTAHATHITFKIKNLSTRPVRVWTRFVFFDKDGDKLTTATPYVPHMGGGPYKRPPVELEPGEFTLIASGGQSSMGTLSVDATLYPLIHSFDVELFATKP